MPDPRPGPPGSAGRPSCCARCGEDHILYPTTHEYAVAHKIKGRRWKGIRWFCHSCRKNTPLVYAAHANPGRPTHGLTMDEQENILGGGGSLRNREPRSLFHDPRESA